MYKYKEYYTCIDFMVAFHFVQKSCYKYNNYQKYNYGCVLLLPLTTFTHFPFTISKNEL